MQWAFRQPLAPSIALATQPAAWPDRRSLACYCALVGSLVAVATGFLATDFTLGSDFQIVAFAGLLALLIGIWLRKAGMELLGTAVEAFIVMAAISLTAVLGSILLAAAGRPLGDAWLSHADAILFPSFNWHATMVALAQRPRLLGLASISYASLIWQPRLLILIHCARDRADQCWTFLLAWTIAIIVAILSFGVLPCLGAYAFHGIGHGQMAAVLDPSAWHYPEIVAAVRNGQLRLIGTGALEGLVTFPSFHAASAVLLGWSYWSIPKLRWPFALLNAAMFLSSVPIGGHYLVDVIAGAALGGASILAAKAIQRRICGSA
jgi:membrane-associated phospholipid phosphatase